MGNGTFPACGVRHARVLYKPWWKRSRLQEKQLMVSPVAILFLLKNAPNCTSEHPYFQNFLRGGGASPQTPLVSAAYAASRFAPGALRPPKELPSNIFWIRPCSPLVETRDAVDNCARLCLDLLVVRPHLPYVHSCHSCDEFSQAFPVFCRSSASVYYCQRNRRAKAQSVPHIILYH